MSSETSPATALLPDRLVVLAGASHQLVYADYPMPKKSSPDYAKGELHVLSQNGADRNLGTGVADANPASADAFRFSIVGTTLTAYSPADPSHVLWWNVAGNQHGIGTLPAGAQWQGASPHGWLFVAVDHLSLGVESTAGSVSSLGQPLPEEVDAAGSITAISGTRGVVALGAKTGTAGYQHWGSAGAVVPLDLGPSAGSLGLSCGDVSGAILGCVDRGSDGSGSAELAVPLDGSAPHTYAGCGADPTAVGTRLVWVCGSTHAHPRFGSGAASIRSPNWVAPQPGFSALGEFVTLGHRQRVVVGMGSAHALSRTLVAVPSPIARLNATTLRAAAQAVVNQAINSGALSGPPSYRFPAQALQAGSDALIRAARAADPSLQPTDTRAVMGPVPYALTHRAGHRPRHRHIRATHTLRRFRHAIPAHASGGIGTHATHGGHRAAPFQRPDGVYVDPRLPRPSNPTVGMVAIWAGLQKLGQPYVWAAAGPSTFDCSGLVQWAYARAGLRFTHFSGAQWNEGRLIKPKQILPGDLLLFDHRIGGRQVIHHVAIYLGAGWMLNAPFTSQYVNVVPVPSGVAGAVRP